MDEQPGGTGGDGFAGLSVTSAATIASQSDIRE
jgi:hypothetical protein